MDLYAALSVLCGCAKIHEYCVLFFALPSGASASFRRAATPSGRLLPSGANSRAESRALEGHDGEYADGSFSEFMRQTAEEERVRPLFEAVLFSSPAAEEVRLSAGLLYTGLVVMSED